MNAGCLCGGLALSAVLLTGCSHERDASRDDSFEFRESFRFHFADRQHYTYTTYATTDQARDIASRLVVGATWRVPDDLTIESPAVSARIAYTIWSSGRISYSTLGFEITTSGVITVARSARSGSRDVLLELPALRSLGSELGAEAVFPDGSDVLIDTSTLRVASVAIHAFGTASALTAGTKRLLFGFLKGCPALC